ncbi:putative periplasmic metal-binding protein [Tepiditoga spiralis]|uniref:Putative periplasmic metal-binding protein n=1 Tax=Tepiditoga spiralis TaxID=2108365 RepID=A0A7G1G9R2_9BACT|nr:metal ABC transporter substrate-binding protein [Tepiditoga spiralis]BBE30822.1 putative periplasmic metal-binding protein [Tepiditoga spiralis]
MKKLILMIVLLFSMVAFSLNISTTIYPYYLVLKEIAPKDSINLIVEPGKSPHTYALTPKDMAKVYRSNIIIGNGLNAETFIEKLLSNLKKKNIEVLLCGDSIPKKELINVKNEGINPHIWLNPKFMYEYIIPNILEKLIILNPKEKNLYEKNSKKLIERLKKLDVYLLNLSNNINGSIYTFHPSFDYFAQRYGIKIAGIIETSPGVEPSAKQLKELSKNAKGVKAIFTEPQLNGKSARKISETLKINKGILDPIGSFEIKKIDELYINNMFEILKKVDFYEINKNKN